MARASVGRVAMRFDLTLDGLADVDAVKVVSQQAVEAWADSLDSDAPLPLPSADRQTE